jgi:hypothetical protein
MLVVETMTKNIIEPINSKSTNHNLLRGYKIFTQNRKMYSYKHYFNVLNAL